MSECMGFLILYLGLGGSIDECDPLGPFIAPQAQTLNATFFCFVFLTRSYCISTARYEWAAAVDELICFWSKLTG